MPKKATEKKMTREDYENKIVDLTTEVEELRNQMQEQMFLANQIEYRKEVLTFLNKIAQNTQDSSQAGKEGDGDAVYLPETPSPEPKDEEDF